MKTPSRNLLKFVKRKRDLFVLGKEIEQLNGGMRRHIKRKLYPVLAKEYQSRRKHDSAHAFCERDKLILVGSTQRALLLNTKETLALLVAALQSVNASEFTFINGSHRDESIRNDFIGRLALLYDRHNRHQHRPS